MNLARGMNNRSRHLLVPNPVAIKANPGCSAVCAFCQCMLHLSGDQAPRRSHYDRSLGSTSDAHHSSLLPDARAP